MKKLYPALFSKKTSSTFIIIMMMLLGYTVKAQTTFYTQGFETTNDWTLNSGATITGNENWWVWGSGGNVHAGVNAVQIWYRNSGNTAWDANYSLSRTCSRDMTKVFNFSSIPTGATITFSYWIICRGEANYDDCRVLVNGTDVTGALQNITAWSQRTIDLSAYAGNSSVTVVFRWRNDNSAGTRPAARIDDIAVTYTGPCPSTPSLSVSSGNGTQVNSGTTIYYTASPGSPTAGTFGGTQYQWNTTAGAWSGAWVANGGGWTASSPANTLYVRAWYTNNGCTTYSNIVSTPVVSANVGWTAGSNLQNPTIAANSCGGYSSTWCAGSGTYTYLNNGLTPNCSYTVENTGGSGCGTAMANAYLQAWWNGGGTECGWGAIGVPALNSYTFTANPSAASGQHILNVTRAVYIADGNACGEAQGHDFTNQSAVLRFKQNTTVANGTSNAALCVGSTRAVSATLANNAGAFPTISWSVIPSTYGTITGISQGTVTSNGTFTPAVAGAGNNVTIRATVGSCYQDVVFTINGKPAAPTLAVVNNCGNSTLTASGFTGTLNWSDGGSGNPRTVSSGSYTVTQTLSGCTSNGSNSVTAAPTAVPAAPTLAVVNNCGTSTLTASGFTGTLTWSDGGSGNPRTVGAGTYTVRQTIAGCISGNSNSVTAAPTAVPSAPTLAVVNGCGSSTLTASGVTGTLTWSDAGSGNPRTVGAGTYTVRQTVAGCISAASNSVTAAPTAVPATPSLAVVNNCGNSTLTVTGTTGTLTWSDGGSGNPRTVTSGSYTVTQTISGCTSLSSNSVTAAPTAVPSAPTLAVVNNCGNSTLTASGVTGTLTWSDAGTGNPRTVGAGTYTVRQTVSGCISANSNSVTAAPTAVPGAPTLAVVNNCGNSTLTASGFTGTLTWSDAGTGNPRTVGAGTYTVSQTVAGCISANSNSVTAAPTAVPSAPTLAVVNNCGNSTITASGVTGTLNWSDAGTGNPRTVTSGSYTVTQTVGGCNSASSNSVTAAPTAVPGAPTLAVVNNCGNSTLTASGFTGTLTWSDAGSGNPRTVGAGTYTVRQTVAGCISANSNSVTAAPTAVPSAPTLAVANNCGNSTLTASGVTGTLTWSDAGTGNPRTVGAGTYTVQQTVAGCISSASNSVTANPTISNAPTLAVVNNCTNSTITASGFTGTLTWSDAGTGNPRTVTSGSFTVTQTVGSCVSPASNSVTANPTGPAAPTLAVVNNCGNSTITASGFTGTLNWSDAGTGNPRTVGAGTYTVTQTVGSCTSSASNSVTAAPTPVPSAPTLAVVNNCGNSTLTASGVTGTLTWSDAGTGNPRTVGAGSYTVRQTVAGCISANSNSVTAAPIAVPSAPTLAVVNNCGNSTITASGVTGTLTWSDGGSGNPRTVTSGSYVVTQTVAGCISASSNSVTANPTAIPSAPTLAVVNNCGNSTLTASGFTGTLTWSDAGTGNPRTVGAGTYTVTQTVAGCASANSNSVTAAPTAVPGAPTLAVVNNCGNSTITASGVTGTLTWSDAGTGNPRTVTSGSYTVTQTVAGCTSLASNSVTANPTAVPGAPTLAVVNNCGTSTLTASAFTGTLTWSDAGTGNPRSVGAGTYTVRQTVAGCISANSNSVTATPTAVPSAPTLAVVNNCGSSTLTASGFTGTLTWSDAGTGNPRSVGAGTYTVTQTVGGCASLASNSVTANPTAVPATPGVTVVNNCGSSTLTATGYSGTLLWSTSETTASITAATAGAYTVTQTVAGCTSAAGSGTAAPYSVPATPTATVTAQPGCVTQTGTITVTAPTGGTISYSVDGSTYTNTNGVFTGLTPGPYNVTAKNSIGGCVSPATALTINPVPTPPSLPVASVTAQPTCAVTSGTITVSSPVGAVYEYQLNSGTYQSNPVFATLAAGNYTLNARLIASPDCISPTAGSYTVNASPTPLTTTPINVCQGGQGDLTATSVCVDNFVVPVIQNSIYGGWLASNSTAATPVGMVNSTFCSFAGAARTYSVIQFQVTATGNYIFEMNDNSTYNGAGYIMTGAFTPGVCPSGGAGTMVRMDNDGGNGDEPKLGSVGSPLALTAGITYSLVSTTEGASNVINNDYTWTITPPAGENVMLNEPGTVEWYTASSGGSPIGYGTTFDPIGVPGSGLANTNTVGTTYFYAACSSSPSCRTQAAYTVTTTAPTFNVTPVNGSTCYNSSSSVSIGLSGSVSGYPYQIYKDGSSAGMPTATTGTGGAITLGSVSADGVYTVAVHSGSCDIPMDGTVTIKPVPVANAGTDVSLPCNNIIGLTGSSNSTTLFTEDFGATTNTQLSPTSSGWRLKYLYGTHPANRTEWWIGYNGGSPYSISCATAGAALSTVDNRQYQSDVPCDYAWDAGTLDEIAYNTTPVDARLYTSVNVSFNYVAGGNYSASVVRDYMQVMYSLDNGVNWVAVNAGNNVGSYTLNRQLNGTTNAFFSLTSGTSQTGVANVSMPSAVIGQKFLLGFRWVNDGNLTGDFVGNMMVDNINITGAASYSWSPTSGVTNDGTSTPTVTQAATYTLVVTAGNGCTASDDVVVGPAPGNVTGTIASGDQTGLGGALCADGTRDPNNITFSTPASAGSTYLWYYKDVAGAIPAAAPVPGSGVSGWTSAAVTTASFNPTAYPIAMAGKSRTYACFVTSGCAVSDWASSARKVTVDDVFTQNSNPDNCFNIDNSGSNYYVLVTANGGTPGSSGYTWPVTGAVTYGAGNNGSLSTNTRIYEFPLAWSGTIPVTDALGCVAAGGNSQTVYITTTQPDDISSAAFVGPGTETATNDCYDLGFDRWVTYYDPSEKIIMAINARDNNLGLVNVSMYRNADEPYILNSATNTDACYLSAVRAMERHFVVTTANSPTTWGGTNKVGVRLFFTETELQDVITETYGINGSSNWNTTCATDDDVTTLTDLYVTKYTAPAGQLATEDGDYTNNLPAQTGGLYRIFGAGTTPALGNGPLTHDGLGNFTALYGGGNAHHYVEMEVEEFSEFWLHGSAHIMPLPVTMLYLEANAINNAYIQIKWATSVEVNNDGFNVERSVDGQTWEKIGFVNGHDNTTTQTVYTYDDLNVTAGVVYYYRLKQVDNDGAFEYTDIVSAKLTGETSFSVKDFIPNPTMDKTKLIITGTKDQEISVTFYNVVGQKVLESSHLVNKGGNMIEFDLAKLASGTYTAVVSSANEVYTKKVVLAK